MRFRFIVVLAICTFVQSPVMAQQAGENINVLPVVLPEDQNGNPVDDWFVKGDGYLQRQVEPTIAASTRNPDHLIAFFNDYRAVDIPDDIGLGETETMIALVNTARTVMVASSWLSMPNLPDLQLPPIAAAEAWIGMSRSYDGGLTWSGGFLPGAPFDTASQATLDAPVFGLEAATDPVVAPGPCGKFYLVFMAFNRGDESKLVVARYQDLNNLEGGDSIVYQGMTVIESGNNATHGYFLDKPDIEVDVFRESSADVCADRVYVSYSTFNGLDKDGKFQSKISFARSFDDGLTFDTQKLNPPYNQNQGSALAVDPREGKPRTTGGGTIYMIWRHFFDPDLILMTRSTDYGRKWGKPEIVTGNLPMAPFDQPSISSVMAPLSAAPNSGFPEVAFRSNGFPTAAVTDQGKLYVAWQERVDIDPNSSTFGHPFDGGSPRIVVVRSEDGGDTWTDVDGNLDDRRAVDMADRDAANPPDPGFGALPQPRPSGPQVQPKIVFSGGQLLLAYFESRGRIANYGTENEFIVAEAHVSPYTGFISGYDRLLDFRAALLDPLTGDLLNPGSTTQVSRYPIRAGADLSDGEDLSDVAAVNSPCSPDSGAGYQPCVRQVNRANAVQSAAGTIPFIGDYPDAAPIVQFVPNQNGTAWRWATAPGDVPYQAFHTIFTDNRHLIPPTEIPVGEDPNQPEWDLYKYYSPPGENLLCLNAGSRNTDVLTSKVDAELVLTAPTSYKQLDNQRGFPFTLSNRTGSTRSYNVALIEGADAASFSRYDPTVDGGDVEIFPYSSTSLMVFADAWASSRVRVQVTELGCATDCATGTITFNLDPDNPPLAALDGPDTQYPEVTDPFVINPFVINDGAANPFVINPFVINPFVINPFVINPFVINPFVINPFVINPFVINSTIEDVVDTTWTVTAGTSNTASSYLPLINIDNAQAFLNSGYAFQLIVHKGSLYGSFDGCNPVNVAQPQILANVTQDPQAANPFVINPFVINPFVINPFVINPFVINSTFTMAPSDDSNPDGTTKAPPASNEVKITLRAFKLDTGLKNGGLVYDPLQDPPSLVVVPLPCDPENPENCDVFSLSPDLIAVGVDTSAVIADAGGTLVGFPSGGWKLRNQGQGDATAENGILRHGFYICDISYVDSLPPNAPLDVTDPLCTATAEFLPSASNTLALGAEEPFDPVDLSIPILDVGDYYLVLYVDDTREVSERNEINNWVKATITIEEPNEPPVAVDTTFQTDEDTTLSDLLPASDPDLDPLTYTITAGPTDGSLSLVDNAFTYTPDLNFNGADGFDFEVFDGEFTATARVTITVNAINDAPTIGDIALTVDEDGSIEGALAAGDVDGDSLLYSVTTPPTIGTITPIDPDTGTFTYSPNEDANGTDTFGVSVSDGNLSAEATVTVTVSAVADAPVAVDDATSTAEEALVTGTLTATDADNDVLSYSLVSQTTNGTVTVTTNGTFSYIPATDFNGSDEFTFKANDGGLDSNIATVSITVTPVNDPPVASDASFSTNEGIPLSATLPAFDVDDGDTANFSITVVPSFGAVVIDDPATGAFTYTPAAWFAGMDSFTFLVADGSDASDSGVITVTVIDPVPNWDFVGFATPWRPDYAVNAGSAVPLKWHYADTASGQKVASYSDGLQITAVGHVTCDPDSTVVATLALPEDAGSSDLRYVSGDWQLNWDTSNQPLGCYFLSIYHPTTNQIDTRNAQGQILAIVLQ